MLKVLLLEKSLTSSGYVCEVSKGFSWPNSSVSFTKSYLSTTESLFVMLTKGLGHENSLRTSLGKSSFETIVHRS